MTTNRLQTSAMLLAWLGLGGLTFGGVYYASRPTTHKAERPAAEDWCAEHRIAEADCPWCQPAIIEARGECREHGVPEALCSRCHRALIAAFQSVGDWCAEHGLPESQCDVCAAPRSPAPDLRLEPGRLLRAPREGCVKAEASVLLRSPEVATAIGLETAPVERREVARELRRHAELRLDDRATAAVAARAGGVVIEVLRGLGDEVTAGEALAVVEAPALGEAAAALAAAQARAELWRRNLRRERELLSEGIGSERPALEAEAALAEASIAARVARQRLRSLGLGDEELEHLAEGGALASRLSLRAPFAGTVVACAVTRGEVVEAGQACFRVSDLSALWAQVELRASDLALVRPGQRVQLRIEEVPGLRGTAELFWVGAQLDERTRTLPALARIPNPEGRLRAGLYGEASIRVSAPEGALVVPREALQWEGCCNLVFLRESPTRYRPRPVQVAFVTGALAVVTGEGLESGAEVVTTGSFLLKTEILKGSIGAGCCGE